MVELIGPLDWLKALILAFFGSCLPAFLFNLNPRKTFFVGLSGLLGWGTYLICYQISKNVVFASFLGSCTVGLYSEIITRVTHAPSPAFAVGGIFPLVPGITAFTAIQYFLEGHKDLAVAKGLETLLMALAIALGILLIASIFSGLKPLRTKEP